MDINFTGLKAVFAEAVHRHEPTILFELRDGVGQFVFMLFVASDSKGEIKFGDLELFIFLGRTQRMLGFSLYGNFLHAGDFRVYLKKDDVNAIRHELGITASPLGVPFDVHAFFGRLNAQIPETIPLHSKIESVQRYRDVIEKHCKKFVNQATKIYLIGPKRLPTGSRPREETLRKLYKLSEDAVMIARLIDRLKERNLTTAWTDDPNRACSFAELWAKVFES